MAYFFSLAVECGDEDRARACADHFSRPDPALLVSVRAQQSGEDGAWWAVVIPADESTSGVYSDEVAQSLTAAGNALLERLRSAPPFRFAVVGVEAYEAIALADLDAETGADPSFPERFDGLVVSEEVAAKLGGPLEPFAPGYSWIPYRGEQFRAATGT